MKTITFYSYKGGVGRTLALSNIAKRLAEFGKKVCIMDFDLDAPGLHHKFKKNIKGINRGIIDYIHYFNSHNSIPESITDYVTPVKFNNKKYKDIDFISAGNVDSDKYWKILFSIDWISLFYKKNSQGVALFVDLKERIKKELKPDYLLIDSRTGISEISGITMSLMADEIVLFAAKNEENLHGIKQIIKTLAKPENTLTGKLPNLIFVLCRVPYFEQPEEKIIKQRAINEVNRDLKAFINEFDLPVDLEKLFIIHSDPALEIEEKLLMGYQHEKDETNEQRKYGIKSPIATDYLELFEELTKGKLTDKEKLLFNNIKKSESLIEKTKNLKDINKKNELLIDAIKLNPKSDEAYSLLAKNYFILTDYKNALNNINRAIELNPESNDYLYNTGIIIYKMGKIEDALNIFKELLKRGIKNYKIFFILGLIESNKKNYKKALENFLKALKLNPDSPEAYNSVGNIYRLQKKFKEAFDYVFKALELNPKHMTSTATLAEIYAQIGNHNEFYKNFELSLSFGMTKENLERIFKEEDVYKPYFKEAKFTNLLTKYNLDIDVSKFI